MTESEVVSSKNSSDFAHGTGWVGPAAPGQNADDGGLHHLFREVGQPGSKGRWWFAQAMVCTSIPAVACQSACGTI